VIRSEFSEYLNSIFNLSSRQSTNTPTSNEIFNSNSNLNNSNTDSIYNSTRNSSLIENNVLENNMYNDNSSVCEKVFKFLLGGRSINSTREWKEFYEGQTKPNSQRDITFLTVAATSLNKIIPIAIGQQWTLFNRYNFKNTTKSVNAEETVRQASRLTQPMMIIILLLKIIGFLEVQMASQVLLLLINIFYNTLYIFF